MSTLSTELRNKLEKVVTAGRNLSEKAAKAALETLAVHHHEPFTHMTPAQRTLRNQLRARARQVGDTQDSKGQLSLTHLVHECAYEHWHRMLFARFLAENNLLMLIEEGEKPVAVSLDDCKELAKEAKTDLWTLAGRYAQKMLPKIFRPDDPLLQVTLARENQIELERELDKLSATVFTAGDSLGWCYQFWQAEQKEIVNKSGRKIGADELPAVTQLFTEDYMVEFLLHNTLGAWWAAKQFANDDLRSAIESEAAARQAVALPGCSWKYLRFIKSESVSASSAVKSNWQPASGRFDGWPKTVKELRLLDPCMGSGHFLVFALLILARMRMAEEKLSAAEACVAVLRDNLSGLELDARCTQIAAFNLALAAWKLGGYQTLPPLNLACSGLGVNAREADWLAIAGDNGKLQRGMQRLYQLFRQAPVLGSLINPRALGGDLLVANFHELQPLLEQALQREKTDDAHEMAVTAQGVAKAAEILAGQFTLVATNVPYLAMRKQAGNLRQHLFDNYHSGKACLSAAFVQRTIEFSAPSGTVALVTPQHWLFQSSYDSLRKNLLEEIYWNLVVMLGPGAFETISGEIVNVALMVSTNSKPDSLTNFHGLDCNAISGIEAKTKALVSGEFVASNQLDQLKNPDTRISFEENSGVTLLEAFAVAPQGIITGDLDRWQKFFWEMSALKAPWSTFLSTTPESGVYRGREHIIDWRDDGREMIRPRLGNTAIGRLGVAVSQIGDLPVSLYLGELYDGNVAPLVPKDLKHRAALWALCESEQFLKELRKLDKNMKVTNGVLLKVPFDLAHWQKVAAEKYPHGLPKPFSGDPTQWLFNGHPAGADQPLQTAVARLLGYQWPRQTGSSFPDCPALGPDGLEKFTDDDGIVCLPSVRGEAPAAERLRKLLAMSHGADWKSNSELALIHAIGSNAGDLDEWLRDEFFEEHCGLFQQRPFVWHIWDGRKRDGFHALVNYHTLASGDKGRRTLENLTHSYLGDWITRQKDSQKRGEEGADERLAAALALKEKLEAILTGEPPFDVFVRWKPLAQQAIGWQPDINDGVRMNIRPFATADILRKRVKIKWEKDRGNEPKRERSDFPWFWKDGAFTGERLNDVHLKNEEKQKARNI